MICERAVARFTRLLSQLKDGNNNNDGKGPSTMISTLSCKENNNNNTISNVNNNKNIKVKKYGLLISGSPPEGLHPVYGDFGTVWPNFIKNDNDDENNIIYEKYYCYSNQFPNEKQLEELDGIILSGSRFDAHDTTTPWIQKLKAFCQQVIHFNDNIDNDNNNNNNNNKKSKKKIIGICFGHQLLSNVIADGYSGRAPPNVGWEIGSKTISFTEDFYKRFPNAKYPNLTILESHRDQVLKLPSTCTLLAKSANTPVEMYCYKDYMLCIQGHPEFTIEFITKLFDMRRNLGILGEDEYKKAILTMEENKPHATEWKNIIRDWLDL